VASWTGTGDGTPTPLGVEMHSLQAESEIFRRGTCQEAEEEEAYEEYQKKMRQKAKEKAKGAKTGIKPAEKRPPPQQPPPTNVQSILEKEHDVRTALRESLEEREHRLDKLVSEKLSVGSSTEESLSGPMTADELKEELRANDRAQQGDSVEFVAMYRQ
jgi:hypothetical protein